jgi:hypothetical protein
MLVLTPVSLNNKNSLSAKIPIHIETMCAKQGWVTESPCSSSPSTFNERERVSGEWAPHILFLSFEVPRFSCSTLGFRRHHVTHSIFFLAAHFTVVRAAKTCERREWASLFSGLYTWWNWKVSGRRSAAPAELSRPRKLIMSAASIDLCAAVPSLCAMPPLCTCCTLVSLYATLPRTIFANTRVQSQLTLKGHSVNYK